MMWARGVSAGVVALGVVGCGASGIDPQEARTWVEQTYGGSDWTELYADGEQLDRVYGVRVDGDCAAVEFSRIGRDMHDTAFVRHRDGEWVAEEIVTGTIGMEWVDGSAERCFTRPETR